MVETISSKNGRLTVPSFFTVEVVGTLSRLTREEDETRKAIQDITSLHKLRVVQMNSSFMQLAANLAIDLHLRAGDATYVALAHQLQIPLIT
jgi:predicted nucleic acid-binding protein